MLNSWKVKFIYFYLSLLLPIYCKEQNYIINKEKDLIKGLSDSEINLALSDLTLSDLNALSKFIETSNPYKDDSVIDGFIESNKKVQPDMSNEHFKFVLNKNQLFRQDQIVSKHFKNSINENNFRIKRANQFDNSKIITDEQYFKELINSFPRDGSQNSLQDSKQDHVRVKRN